MASFLRRTKKVSTNKSETQATSLASNNENNGNGSKKRRSLSLPAVSKMIRGITAAPVARSNSSEQDEERKEAPDDTFVPPPPPPPPSIPPPPLDNMYQFAPNATDQEVDDQKIYVNKMRKLGQAFDEKFTEARLGISMALVEWGPHDQSFVAVESTRSAIDNSKNAHRRIKPTDELVIVDGKPIVNPTHKAFHELVATLANPEARPLYLTFVQGYRRDEAYNEQEESFLMVANDPHHQQQTIPKDVPLQALTKIRKLHGSNSKISLSHDPLKDAFDTVQITGYNTAVRHTIDELKRSGGALTVALHQECLGFTLSLAKYESSGRIFVLLEIMSPSASTADDDDDSNEYQPKSGDELIIFYDGTLIKQPTESMLSRFRTLLSCAPRPIQLTLLRNNASKKKIDPMADRKRAKAKRRKSRAEKAAPVTTVEVPPPPPPPQETPLPPPPPPPTPPSAFLDGNTPPPKTALRPKATRPSLPANSPASFDFDGEPGTYQNAVPSPIVHVHEDKRSTQPAATRREADEDNEQADATLSAVGEDKSSLVRTLFRPLGSSIEIEDVEQKNDDCNDISSSEMQTIAPDDEKEQLTEQATTEDEAETRPSPEYERMTSIDDVNDSFIDDSQTEDNAAVDRHSFFNTKLLHAAAHQQQEVLSKSTKADKDDHEWSEDETVKSDEMILQEKEEPVEIVASTWLDVDADDEVETSLNYDQLQSYELTKAVESNSKSDVETQEEEVAVPSSANNVQDQDNEEDGSNKYRSHSERERNWDVVEEPVTNRAGSLNAKIMSQQSKQEEHNDFWNSIYERRSSVSTGFDTGLAYMHGFTNTTPHSKTDGPSHVPGADTRIESFNTSVSVREAAKAIDAVGEVDQAMDAINQALGSSSKRRNSSKKGMALRDSILSAQQDKIHGVDDESDGFPVIHPVDLEVEAVADDEAEGGPAIHPADQEVEATADDEAEGGPAIHPVDQEVEASADDEAEGGPAIHPVDQEVEATADDEAEGGPAIHPVDQEVEATADDEAEGGPAIHPVDEEVEASADDEAEGGPAIHPVDEETIIASTSVEASRSSNDNAADAVEGKNAVVVECIASYSSEDNGMFSEVTAAPVDKKIILEDERACDIIDDAVRERDSPRSESSMKSHADLDLIASQSEDEHESVCTTKSGANSDGEARDEALEADENLNDDLYSDDNFEPAPFPSPEDSDPELLLPERLQPYLDMQDSAIEFVGSDILVEYDSDDDSDADSIDEAPARISPVPNEGRDYQSEPEPPTAPHEFFAAEGTIDDSEELDSVVHAWTQEGCAMQEKRAKRNPRQTKARVATIDIEDDRYLSRKEIIDNDGAFVDRNSSVGDRHNFQDLVHARVVQAQPMPWPLGMFEFAACCKSTDADTPEPIFVPPVDYPGTL